MLLEATRTCSFRPRPERRTNAIKSLATQPQEPTPPPHRCSRCSSPGNSFRLNLHFSHYCCLATSILATEVGPETDKQILLTPKRDCTAVRLRSLPASTPSTPLHSSPLLSPPLVCTCHPLASLVPLQIRFREGDAAVTDPLLKVQLRRHGQGRRAGGKRTGGVQDQRGQEEEESKVTRPSGAVAVGAARSYRRQTPARETPGTFEREAQTHGQTCHSRRRHMDRICCQANDETILHG